MLRCTFYKSVVLEYNSLCLSAGQFQLASTTPQTNQVTRS